jgi:hypothetical protein
MQPGSHWCHERTPEVPGALPSNGRTPIDAELSERYVEVLPALPVSLDAEELVMHIAGSGHGIPCESAAAIAVAAFHGLGPRPVVDFVLNWTSTSDENPQGVRLRSDEFDPRPLAPGEDAPADALCRFVERLLASSGAKALPDDAEGSASEPQLARIRG